MESIWSHNGSANPSHFLLPIYFAFSFFLARFVLDRFIFRKLAIWLLYSKAKAISSRNDEATIVKCSESMWKLTYYATVEICALKITCNEPWFRDTKEYFRGWPHQELRFPIMLFYMCQCGFYIYSIAALLIWETRRKDFSVMMSHHVITVVLIGYSYITRFFRIGMIILALHDASDVFLEAAKVFKYSGKELRASILFGLFAISWVILRLVFFPFWIIKATSYELVEFLDSSLAYHKLLYYVFNTMLLMLLVFHIYWWILIYSMIMRQLRNRGRVGEDIRSGKPSALLILPLNLENEGKISKQNERVNLYVYGCLQSFRIPSPSPHFTSAALSIEAEGRKLLKLYFKDAALGITLFQQYDEFLNSPSHILSGTVKCIISLLSRFTSYIILTCVFIIFTWSY